MLDSEKDASTYPPETLWRLKPEFRLILARTNMVKTAWQEIEESFPKGNELTHGDLRVILDKINAIPNAILELVLADILLNQDLRRNYELIYLLLETFVWQSYAELTLKLTNRVRKMKDIK